MSRPTRLDRAVSMNVDNRRPIDFQLKTKTITPSLMGRWKSFRQCRRLSHGQSPPADDEVGLAFFETEESSLVANDLLSIKICKETIRNAIVENMRNSSSRDVKTLMDIENGVINSTDMEPILINYTRVDRNICFLWCAFLKKIEYLDKIAKIGIDLSFSIPGEGLTALHLSAFSGCAKCCKWLIEKGSNVNITLELYTPLHCAVLGNSTETTTLLLKHGAEIHDTVLHYAVRANATECLALLVNRNVDINALDASGMSPLHIAADRRMELCLEILLNCTKIDINLETSDKRNTALHLASEGGYADCVTMLIMKGAEIDKRNTKLQTPLHLAAKCQGVECVEGLLKAGADVNATDADGRTPLRGAVGKALFAYNTVETLIRWKADVNLRDKYGFSALHVAALNELSQCVDTLIMEGADVSVKTKGGLTPLSIISKKTPASLATICRKLDSSISLHDPEISNREVEVKLDFRYLVQQSSAGEVGLLKTLIDEGQKNMLEHPLCGAFLYIKWLKIRRFYQCRLFFSFTFVALFTIYVMTALAHKCYNAAKNVSTHDVDLCRNNSEIAFALIGNPKGMEITWYVLVIFTICEMCRKLLGLAGYRSLKQYFIQWTNVIEWFTVFSVFATSFIYTGRTYMWQNHIGAFGVLCAWTTLMVIIGQNPVFGTYVAMFTKVQAEFAKLFLAYFFLLVGFTVSFCVIFPMSNDFKNPFLGFIKVLVMMTGELDMDMLVSSDKNNLLLEISAHIIYILFLSVITVVLMNLLVGIAVHDIQGLLKTAGLSRLVRQTELISFLELALFQGFLPRRVIEVLKWTALVSPSAYRVVLHVKPFNPRENRLPRDILLAAHEIAQRQRKCHSNTITSTTTYRYACDVRKQDGYKQMAEEVRNMKQLLEEQQQSIMELIATINRRNVLN